MVYNGKPYWNGWFGGKPTIFGNIHIFPFSNLQGFPPVLLNEASSAEANSSSWQQQAQWWSLFGQNHDATRGIFFYMCGWWMRVGVSWSELFCFCFFVETSKLCLLFFSLKVFVLFFRGHQLIASFHRISRSQNHLCAATQVKQIHSRSPQGS